MTFILALLVLLLSDVICIYTGRAILVLLTNRRWRGERLESREGAAFCAAGALSFKRDGQRVLTVAGLWVLGAAFYGIALILAVSLLGV